MQEPPITPVPGAIPSTDNPLSLFDLMRATPRQSGPCWLAFLWKRGTCPLHPEPLGVSVWSDGPAVHVSANRLLSGLVEGTVPGTGNTGA